MCIMVYIHHVHKTYKEIQEVSMSYAGYVPRWFVITPDPKHFRIGLSF